MTKHTETPREWDAEFNERFSPWLSTFSTLKEQMHLFIREVEDAARTQALQDAVEALPDNEKIPCDCPKGGLIGENEYPCDECGGSQWKKKHVCAFNDGEQNCECYETAISEARAAINGLRKEREDD